MTTYISEAEYEKRFNKWIVGREPNAEKVTSYLQSRIEMASRLIALKAMESPVAAKAEIVRLIKQAKWDVLRREFEKAFVVHPTGMDKNAIAFYVPDSAKPCRYCGSETHPPGCCAQDGHGG